MTTGQVSTRSFTSKVIRKLRRPFELGRDTYRLMRGAVVGNWYAPTANWGDALNPYLIEKLSGRSAVHERNLVAFREQRVVYSVIGSMLQSVTSHNLEVWGSGFISDGARVRVVPRAIHAVRGPLTRNLLIKHGIECSSVYGDPALLLPYFYKARTTANKHKIGIIPHYLDKTTRVVQQLQQDENVLIIDVYSGTEEFVDLLCSCSYVVSSSLHGIIAADAYGVPAVWVEFSDRVTGNGFKFQDYFESIGVSGMNAVRVDSIEAIYNLDPHVRRRYPLVNSLGLINSCPFIADDVKSWMIATVLNQDNVT